MLLPDVRQALRIHRRRPLTTAAVVVTLALGIGACTAIFSVVDGVLLKPLGFSRAERLVRLHQTYETLRTSPNPRLQAIWNRLPVSYLNAVDYRRDSRAVEAIGLYEDVSMTVTGSGEPRQLEAVRMDAELFAVLAVRPAFGRVFDAGEVEQGARVAVLGHGLWQRSFGGDRGVTGRTLTLDGEPHTVVGVMPAGFQVPGGGADVLWTPLHLGEDDLGSRDNQRLRALARIAEGVSIDDAHADLERLARGQAETFPDTNDGVGVRIEPLLESVAGASRPLLYLLMAAVAAVLAVACVNVAHLLLAETSLRRRELTVRLALGAGRGRLVAQLLTESVLLALAGGALGWWAAATGRDLLLSWIGSDLPRAADVALDGRVLLFTVAVSLVAAACCCVLPALSTRALSARDLGAGRGQTAKDGFLAHSGLAVAQTALTLMLTAGAGLLVASFLRLAAVDPGFRSDGVLVQEVRLPAWSYPDEEHRQAFSSPLLERLRGLPGVRGAALTTKLPFAGPGLVGGYTLPGAGDDEDGDWTQGRSASMKFVTPEYFRVLGIPLRRGRVFTASDRPESGRRLVVNETMAKASWPGAVAIGRTVVLGYDDQPYEVIGVVADVRHDGLDAEPGALMYQPWSQRPALAGAAFTAVVAAADATPLDASTLRAAIRELDPELPLPPSTTMAALLEDSLAGSRSRTWLMSSLAAVALVLALVGTYAVVSFDVGRRVPEIGVRMALGANGGRVRAMVLWRTLTLSGLGLLLGALGVLMGWRLLSGWLYGVGEVEPPVFAAAAALMILVSAVAGYLPARRASRVDPAVALRGE